MDKQMWTGQAWVDVPGHYVTAVAATKTEYLIACRCGWTSHWGSPVAVDPLGAAQDGYVRHLAEQEEQR